MAGVVVAPRPTRRRSIPHQQLPSAATDNNNNNNSAYIVDIVNLNNLLSRLEQTIFSSSSDLKLLQQSHLHRARVGANVDYAHTLFTKIERSLPSIKSPEARHDRTTDLAKKRARLARLRERFDGIKADVYLRTGDGVHDDDDDDYDFGEDGGEGEDLLAGISEPTIIRTDEKQHEKDREEGLRDGLGKGNVTTTTITTTTEPSELRQRRQDPASIPPPPTAAAAAATTGFKPTPTTSPPTYSTATTTATAESTLTTHRAEQESLTDSLVNLASQLKASSQAFQASLEKEKSILDRAVEGLDRNVTGLEAAGKRIGILRRMSEGRGWWGRMLMYAWIFALWLVAIAIVYLGPKLRF